FFMFFFSSRRRHTRCYRDWSSDVCSSDLPSPFTALVGEAIASLPRMTLLISIIFAFPNFSDTNFAHVCFPTPGFPVMTTLIMIRSEERRVGNECKFMFVLYF